MRAMNAPGADEQITFDEGVLDVLVIFGTDRIRNFQKFFRVCASESEQVHDFNFGIFPEAREAKTTPDYWIVEMLVRRAWIQHGKYYTPAAGAHSSQ